MNNYFSSDWHLCHKNILKFDTRPFKTIEEHDEFIMKTFMQTVKAGDNFYYLGDIAFTNKNNVEKILQTMVSSGANLYFIKGNHDKDDIIKLYEKYGTYLGEQKKIKVNNQEIVLNHYKMFVWDKSHHGAWHLYGHSHGSAEWYENGKSFDLCIHIWNYKIPEFEDIKKIMDKREFKSMDHHGKREYDPKLN